MKSQIKHIKLRRCFLLNTTLIIMLSGYLSFGQSGDSDWGSWNTIGLEYKLDKKWTFSLEEQLRLKENISVVDEYFTQLGAEYKLFKGFNLAGGVRYIRQNDNQGNIQGYENHFRYNIDATYKHDVDNFTLGYRLRYQNKNELGVSAAEGDYANQNIRLKASIEYNIKKWKLDPKFSAELFNHFEKEDDNGFSKYRLTFGTDYKIKKIGKIGVFYRFEKELNVDLPDVTNIIGLKFIYTIKNK